ncbi:MAG: ABC transporter permease [Candidatus Dormibacteraceae bacterium]
MIRVAQGAVGFVALFLAWHAVAGMHLVIDEYFPPPALVLSLVGELLTQMTFLAAVFATLKEVLAGLVLACLIAIPIGLVLGRSRHLFQATRLIVELLRPLPAVALAPLAILTLGLGLRSIVALVVWTSVWPILINSIYGAQDLDPTALETARSFRLSRLVVFRRIVLPSALPMIATGIRIAVAIAVAVAIAAEMVAGGGEGLGSWILKEGSAGSLVAVYAAAVVAGAIGFALNGTLETAERRMFRWHGAARLQAAA